MNYYANKVVWAANILFLVSYILVSMGAIKGDKKIYNWLILFAVVFYGFYSTVKGYYPVLALNMANTIIGLRVLYRLYFKPKKQYNIPPIIFIVLLGLTGAIVAIATKPLIIEVVGWIAGGIFLTAYFLVSGKKISGDGFAFNLINLAGAISYGTYAVGINEPPILWLEIFFVTISLIALGKACWRLKRKEVIL